MKKLISLFLIFSAFFACEKAVVNITDEPQLKVANEITDITVDEGEVMNNFRISNVFRVYGVDNATYTTSIFSNQNTALVSSVLMGDTLYLTANINGVQPSILYRITPGSIFSLDIAGKLYFVENSVGVE